MNNRWKLSPIKNHTNEKLQKNLEISFDTIYNNFDIKNPLNNDSIPNILFIWETDQEKFSIFADFCNFLLSKISSSDKQYLKKIPFIISNISSFNLVWYKLEINTKRNEVMSKYNTKINNKKRQFTTF